jgi:hypothetical protein
MDPLPHNVLRIYSEHFAKVRATIGASLHQLLDHYGEPKDGALDAKFWHLLNRLHDWRQRYCPKLLNTDRFVRAYWSVRGDVQNGGFEHYLEYSGDTWPDVLRVLELGEAEQACNHFRRVLALFPNSTPSLDQTERARQLQTLNRERPAETSESLSKLASEYYDPLYPADDTLYRALRQLEDEEVVPDLPIPS